MTVAIAHQQLCLDDPPDQTGHGVEALRRLPYQRAPYCRRNWGHPFHSMCSYPSKLKPGIAHFLVQLFTGVGESVLDPFSGVGTIPFEACSQGRIGLGSDLNPLAAIVTRAKVDPPSRRAVDDVVNDVTRAIAVSSTMPSVNEEIASFFHETTLAEISAARRVLLELVDKDAERGSAAAFVLACLAHILHGNRPYALSRRSHNVIPIRPKGAFAYKPLLPHLQEKINRLLAVPLTYSFRPGRAARLGFTEIAEFGEVDHVISSPPFLGTTHFVRQNRVRLWLCGWDYETQDMVKPGFLEHQAGLEAYGPMFTSFHRLVKRAGRCVLHLGVVKNTDMATALAPYAVQAGFTINGVIYEDAGHLESHGRTDRGGTHRHQFLILTKS